MGFNKPVNGYHEHVPQTSEASDDAHTARHFAEPEAVLPELLSEEGAQKHESVQQHHDRIAHGQVDDERVTQLLQFFEAGDRNEN